MSLEMLNKDIYTYEFMIDILESVRDRFRRDIKNGSFTQKSFDAFICKHIKRIHKWKLEESSCVKGVKDTDHEDMVSDYDNVIKLFGNR